jgi:ADP-ribose pyrophosphatase YjhB (NUDIX family)
MRMKKNWLSQQNWNLVQRSVPIPCVDVLPFRKTAAGKIEIGLIWRDTPHQGERWCFIGGRVAKNYSQDEALRFQLADALGPAVKPAGRAHPIALCQYFPVRRKNALFDPRQHSIALLYATKLRGRIAITADEKKEARDFAWFSEKTLPPAAQIGFGQRKVMRACIRKLHAAEKGGGMLFF